MNGNNYFIQKKAIGEMNNKIIYILYYKKKTIFLFYIINRLK